MIAWLQGKLIHKQAPHLVVAANGIGYDLQVPITTFYQLPELGNLVTLHVYTHWREDGPTCYGFLQQAQREFFQLLIKVNGVGPKMALAMLAEDFSTLALCFANKDTTTLTKVPGIGKKTAERLMIELADKVEAFAKLEPTLGSAVMSYSAPRHQQAEAVSALESLGYKNSEALTAVNRVERNEHDSVSDIIKKALQGMTP